VKSVPVALVLLLIAIALAVGYFIRVISEPEQVRTATSESDLEVKVMTVWDGAAGYTVEVRYPQLGLPSDAKIKEVVDREVSDFRNLIRDFPPPTIGPYSMEGRFDSIFISSEVVSLRLVFSSYTGGAHGNSVILGLNFDRASTRQLTLSDALTMIDMSIDQVSAEAMAQLEAKLGTSMFPDGASPDPENYRTFVISRDRVTFVFQEYQVAPYASGPQEVSFSRTRR
jgi:hypothetical protein